MRLPDDTRPGIERPQRPQSPARLAPLQTRPRRHRRRPRRDAIRRPPQVVTRGKDAHRIASVTDITDITRRMRPRARRYPWEL